MGIGDWGLGIGDWGLGIGANPQSPIPNPHLDFNKYNNNIKIIKKELIILFNLIINLILYK